MRINSYRSNGRLVMQMGMTLSEIELVFGNQTPDGKHVTLYGSWQDGLIIKARDTDPHKDSDLEGPVIKLQKRTGANPYYIQVAASRIEGNPGITFEPFQAEMVLTGENKEHATVVIPGKLKFKEGPTVQPKRKEVKKEASGAPPLIPSNDVPISRCVQIVNTFLNENTDIFVITEDGKVHKKIQLVKRAFVPF